MGLRTYPQTKGPSKASQKILEATNCSRLCHNSHILNDCYMKKKFKRLYKNYRHRIPTLVALIAIVSLLITMQVFMSANSAVKQRLVTYYDRGIEHVVLTRSETVQEALTAAHVTLSAEDKVEPSLETRLDTTDNVVNIYRARPVLVVDGLVRIKVVTTALTVNDIVTDADLASLQEGDRASFSVSKNIVNDGAGTIVTVERSDAHRSGQPKSPGTGPGPNALSKNKGAQMFTDSLGITHRETYYDLLMNIVIGSCGGGGYTIRYDGAKIDKDGYVLVAANLFHYPRCSIVETSMGLGKVYDTGGFAVRYPYGFDLATDWTNYDGR